MRSKPLFVAALISSLVVAEIIIWFFLNAHESSTNTEEAEANIKFLVVGKSPLYKAGDVGSFVLQDEFGIYHCIYHNGIEAGGLWCERISNETRGELG